MAIAENVEELEKRLKAPFPAGEVEWRVQRSGLKKGVPWAMVFCYITSRAVQDRLDDVAGMGNWENLIKETSDGGFLQGLRILLPSELPYQRRWITKWDGADKTKVEETKGGISGALKRSAALWGIGRYLYHLPAKFAEISKNGKYNGVAKEKGGQDPVYFSWNPPILPKWALPEGTKFYGKDEKNDQPKNVPVVPANGLITEGQIKEVRRQLSRKALFETFITDKFFIDELKKLPFSALNDALDLIRDYEEHSEDVPY